MLLALRDSTSVIVWRVSMGVMLSIMDAMVYLRIISGYYKTLGLRRQANAMLLMIATNMGIQIIIVLAQYKKKSWIVKVKEALICLLFLRPAVDIIRVSTNYKDSEAMFDPLNELLANKVRGGVDKL